jgi:tetratricopeptide (TPR) repeat protein
MSLAAAIAQQMTAEIEIAAGDFAAAVAGGREGCAELERMGERGYMPTNATMLAEALYLLGEDDEAEHWIGRALELADPDDVITQAQARVVRAVIAARRGDAGQAMTSLRDGLRITAGMQEPIWQGRAAMHAATVLSTFGHEDAAREQLQRAVDYFTAKGSTVYAARAAAALAAR